MGKLIPKWANLCQVSDTGSPEPLVSGMYIGEKLRLIYDIMQYTEENDIPGLLLLKDFEKAFDSVSWNFLFSVLKFFNFGESLINWVKVFLQ